MPAYRDVLFLYSLARDLHGPRTAAATTQRRWIVLLPINEGVEFTQPMSFDDLVRQPRDVGHGAAGQPRPRCRSIWTSTSTLHRARQTACSPRT